MGHRASKIAVFLSFLLLPAVIVGCKNVQADGHLEAPPPAKVVRDVDVALFSVEHPEQFPFATAVEHRSKSELAVTGVVSPDVSRNVPVISLASGRVVAIHARLGDIVKQGQLLLTVRSDDVANGFAEYRKAIADELLARKQLQRAKDLFEHGAISMSDLENVQNTEEKAKVDIETMAEHLRLLGNDPEKPNGVVDIVAPVSGVITDQQVTNAAGMQGLGSTPAFTISDLSSVWIVCDVYENDLATVRLGDAADVRLAAYPDRVLAGRVSNIGAILDPQIRTAKVRIEVRNPGLLRLGMFVTATFSGQKTEVRTAVPSTAILHIHDRDYVYVPAPGNKFQRIEVTSGDALATQLQEVRGGIQPGQQVVANALVLEHTIDQ
jgi:cobalt-zinc-cadmium efflux system membrane fusion protein